MKKIKEFFSNCLSVCLFLFIAFGLPVIICMLIVGELRQEDNEKLLFATKCKESGGQYVNLNLKHTCVK